MNEFDNSRAELFVFEVYIYTRWEINWHNNKLLIIWLTRVWCSLERKLLITNLTLIIIITFNKIKCVLSGIQPKFNIQVSHEKWSERDFQSPSSARDDVILLNEKKRVIPNLSDPWGIHKLFKWEAPVFHPSFSEEF